MKRALWTLAGCSLLLLASANDPVAKVKSLESATKNNPMAANWRALADAYVDAGMLSKASNAFYQASTAYEKLGDPNAAKVLEIQGQRYETKIGLFYERCPDHEHLKQNYTGAKYEPVSGCYLGAFVDREDGVESTFMSNDQIHRDPEEFEDKVGHEHAIYFTYLGYGRPFPRGWTDVLYQARAAAHIAFEPRDLDAVQDDEYLKQFAADARRSGVPVFLRYAGEMNGSWVPYGQDPEKYKEKFRLVAHRMHQDAPNVAMVWCPNEIPENRIDLYYPGDDAVDWVGVNFYAVTYNDADRARGAEWMNPADKLRYVYDTYSKKHPIMIGEWAATSFSVVDKLPRPDYAQTKIAELYNALPRIYPRVKAVNWLSMNTIKHAMPGRQLNNYSLLEAPRVAAAYTRAISSPYFIQAVPKSIAITAPVEVAPLTEGTAVTGKVRFSAYVKTYDQRPKVQWSINGQAVYTTDVPGNYDFELDADKQKGPLTIGVEVFDGKGQPAGKSSVKIRSVY